MANNINAENRLKGKKISLNMFSYQNLGDNQSEYDDFIKNQSDVIFFLIEDHIGDKTRDELILASQSFKKTGTPRMYIFLKEFNERTPEIEEAERLINEYCDTYYIEYSNLDDLETKVKERLLQEIDKIEMSSGVSPKMKIKKLRVGLIVSLVTVLLLMSVMAWQFLSKKDDVTLLFIGGGSALNCLLEKDGVRNGDLYEQSITLPIPTKASWPIVSNEYVYQHAVRNDSKKNILSATTCIISQEPIPKEMLCLTYTSILSTSFVICLENQKSSPSAKSPRTPTSSCSSIHTSSAPLNFQPPILGLLPKKR